MENKEYKWNKVKRIIHSFCKDVEEKTIKPSSYLIKDLGLDSISIMAIILKIEKEFNIEINGQDFSDSTVDLAGDILGIILKKIPT